MVRDVIIENMADIGNVQSACGNVRGDEEAQLAGLETRQRRRPGRLVQIAVDRGCREAVTLQGPGNDIDVALAVGEDDAVAHAVAVHRGAQGGALVLGGAAAQLDQVLLDIGTGGGRTGDFDADRVVQEAVDQALDLLWHRGREEQHLPARRHHVEDALQIRDETHVQHAVGFVDDEELHARHQQLATLEMIEQAARRGDQHIGALVEDFLLGTEGDATDQQGHGKPLALGIGLEIVGDLGGQLTRWRDDQRARHARPGPAARQAFDQGQGEGGRLAGARLGDAKDVAPGEGGRDRTGLDRGRFGIASCVDGFEKFWAQSEFGERHGVL